MKDKDKIKKGERKWGTEKQKKGERGKIKR